MWKSLFLLLALTVVAYSYAQQKRQLPNIIIILADDMGYADPGCYGSPIHTTPNIDRMAAEGLRFTSFYAGQPVCTASRAALLTGCYPNRIGMHGALMPESKTGLDTAELTIAKMLKAANYSTAIFGKWHLGSHPDFMPGNHGFDEYSGIPYSNDMWPFHPEQGTVFNFGPLPLYENNRIIDTLNDQTGLTAEITNRSVDFIRRNKEKPFFLYVAHPQPHVPLFVSQQFKGRSKSGLYGDVMMEIDWSVGEILNTLKAQGIDENTLIIFTSDNGPWLSYGTHAGSAAPLREGKGTVWEGGVRVPCIVRYPDKIKKAATISAPMMNIDLLPTIAHITKTKLPAKKIDGKNLWNVWTGRTKNSPQEAYYFYYHTNELHAIRYQNWKMYFPHQYRSLKGRPGGSNGKPAAYQYEELKEPELYDLDKDMAETKNLVNLHPAIVARINKLANAARARMGDALLNIKGTETRPAGAR